MEPIITFIIEKWPFIVVILIVTYIVWKVAHFYYDRFKPIEKKVAELRTESNCTTHRTEIDNLKEMIRNVERILLRQDNNLMDQLSITRSPRQLNDPGRQLYEISGAEDLLRKELDLFIVKLDQRKPKTALDVEYESHSLLLALSDEDIFRPIKNYIYNNPKYNGSDIDIVTICFLMSLELRNLYLEKHPEIHVD